MTNEERKLKFFALLKQDDNVKIQPLVQELGVTAATLRKWRTEYSEIETLDQLDKLVDTDPIIIERAVEKAIDEVADELENLVPEDDESNEDPKAIDEYDDDIDIEDVTEELQEHKRKYRESKLTQFKDSVTGLAVLKQETQAVAGSILNAIQDRLEQLESTSGNFVTTEISSLSDSLVNIQNAFFNKPAAPQIQVNNMNSDSLDSLSTFRERLTN